MSGEYHGGLHGQMHAARIGAYYLLVENGVAKDDFEVSAAPRTAVGVKANGELVLMAARPPTMVASTFTPSEATEEPVVWSSR